MNNDFALTESTYYILLSLYEPQHGYGIMQRTEELSGGRVRLAAGTLYGALSSMSEKGWIQLLPGESGGRKKEYCLTAQGLLALKNELDRLKDLEALTDDDTVLNVHAPYWKWLAAYDILQAAEEITEPVLLLQGEEDYQVTMTDFAIWQETFGEKNNWQMISYPGLTHLFMPGQKSEGSAAYTREARVDVQVIQDIAGFMLAE